MELFEAEAVTLLIPETVFVRVTVLEALTAVCSGAPLLFVFVDEGLGGIYCKDLSKQSAAA